MHVLWMLCMPMDTVQSHLHYCLKESTTSKQSLSGLRYMQQNALLCHWHKNRRSSFPVCLRQTELRGHWQMTSTPSGTGLHVQLRAKRMKRGNALTCHTVSAPGNHSKWVVSDDRVREKPRSA